MTNTDWLDEVQWNRDGLVPIVTQDAESLRVLMLAWANREALEQTVREQRAVYWSRSRGKLWHKGEESGNVQELVNVLLDCDGDTIIYQVRQVGGIACHTGRESCFYRQLSDGGWKTVDPVLKSPDSLYGKKG